MRTLLIPPVALIVTIILMIVFNHFIPLGRFWETHACWIGVPMIVLGLGIAQWHSRLFKKLGTNINTFKEPDILTTEGFFRISRNPMYCGFIVTLLGICLVLGSTSPFLGLIGFGLLTNYWYIPFEERAMLIKFGDQYINYKSKVRRWI